MTRLQRDRQLDRTRHLEWALYIVAFLVAGAAGPLGATPRFLLLLVSIFAALGVVVSLLQYRAMDEFACLRFFKSWALASMVTLAGLSVLVVQAAFAATDLSKPRDVPFWVSSILLIAAGLTASLANVYLRRQTERE